MVFKQFRFNIVLRVLVLTATCLALFITLNSTFMVADQVCGQDQP